MVSVDYILDEMIRREGQIVEVVAQRTRRIVPDFLGMSEGNAVYPGKGWFIVLRASQFQKRVLTLSTHNDINLGESLQALFSGHGEVLPSSDSSLSQSNL